MGNRRKPESWWKTRAAAFERDGYCCVYCGVSAVDARLVGDHKVPLAAGGGWSIENIVTACSWCNARKGILSAEEFMLIA